MSRPQWTDGEIPRWKRWIDCAIAASLLVLTTPIILLSIAAVRLTSSGPGIYKQTRLGLNRRSFTIYKIRTMAHDCEAQGLPGFGAGAQAERDRKGAEQRGHGGHHDGAEAL